MDFVLGVPLPIRLALLFIVGLLAAGPINWATDAWAWTPRWRSSWRTVPKGKPRRTWIDCLPLIGWWRLRREAAEHGSGFWIRPLIVELACGFGLAALYWWETTIAGLITPQLDRQVLGGAAMVNFGPLAGALHAVFVFHAVLGGLMMIASLIDLDDRVIPDEVTVPGTLCGLLLATLLPLGLLPQITTAPVPPVVGIPIVSVANQPLVAMADPLTLQPVHLAASNPWPAAFGGRPQWRGLASGLACWWLWCFAFTRRRWHGRHGFMRALCVVLARVVREFGRTPIREVAIVGTVFITCVWWWGGAAWLGLLTSLVGMIACGGTIWLIRIFASAALGKEAMGFGDVTLMMMVGTFVGWQAGVLIFFLAPFAALLLGIAQLLAGRGDALPYGPFLCLGTAVVIVRWGDLWNYTDPLFSAGWFVPIVLVVCLALCGVMLSVWSLLKRAMLGA